eukprot:g6305.t1 g6305   contig23:158866-160446(+)
MIYSAAVTRFLANSIAFLSPISVTSTEGGGGGVERDSVAYVCGVGEASTDVTPARGHLRRPPRPLNVRKPGSQLPKAPLSKKAKQPLLPTRSSPRLHPQKDAQKELAEPRVLLSTIAEDPPSPSDSDKSPDILAETQETVTILPEPQLGGDADDDARDDDDVPDGVDDASGDALPPLENVTNRETEFSICNSPGEFSALQEASVDDPYHKMLVESAIDYSFGDRVQYFLGGARINNKFRLAVETCVLGEAGKIVCEDMCAKVASLKVQLAQKYEEIMRSLDPGLFESEKLREDMCKRMSGGRPNKSISETTTFGEKKMWEKWKQMKMEMKKIFTCLPATYHKMKSGTQLYEVYDNVIREHWKNNSDRTENEIDAMIDPMFWLEECQYILSVKVHRNNGEWTTDCADRFPGPTRDAMRQNDVQRKVYNRSQAKLKDDSLDGTMKEAMAKESILRSKAKRAKDKLKIVKTAQDAR